MTNSRILFVTGRLAEPALRRTLAELAPCTGLEYEVAVLPISVVALATTTWIADHLTPPGSVESVLLPGLCQGDVDIVSRRFGVRVERGPKDLRDLAEYFGSTNRRPYDYGAHDIEILAEINHAPGLALEDLLARARAARASGADVIDLGCNPGQSWPGVGAAVRLLREQGFRISIDTFDVHEASAAVAAGAELVLSVNSQNVAAAGDWNCEVVAIPDDLSTLAGLDATIEYLTRSGTRFRIDPVLEPIGHGFADSLNRYYEVRRRYPSAEMMMGVGNLTELTDVDSAGVNVVLLGICQGLGIRSVLTTEVINWCRSCVRELDLARRLVYYACRHRVLPKHLEPDLVLLRDPKLKKHGIGTIRELATQIRDANFRIFAEDAVFHLMNATGHLQGTDPFALFRQANAAKAVDPEHAFYLGYEMAKAAIALQLGKNYIQDQALRWGFLTMEEVTHRNTMGSSEP